MGGYWGLGIGVSELPRTPSAAERQVYHYSHKAATAGRADSAKPRPPVAPIRQSRDRRSRRFGKAATAGRADLAKPRSAVAPIRQSRDRHVSSATTGRGFIRRDHRSRLYPADRRSRLYPARDHRSRLYPAQPAVAALSIREDMRVICDDPVICDVAVV